MNFSVEVESGKVVKLPTAGKYCDRDIVVTGEGYTEEDLQTKYNEGVQAEYNRFWDTLQANGSNSLDYRYKFYYWPNEAYTPKYPIRSTKASMASVFQNARIEDTKVDVDFSASTTCNSSFASCGLLHTIPKMIVSEQNTFGSAFTNCLSLVNVTVVGSFGASINFQWSSKLSRDSITSIINALSSTTSGLSVTFSKPAVNTAFETSEGMADGSASEVWVNLVNTRSNWTIDLI